MSATSLLDWRRRVVAMYAEVRANPDPAAAHQTWQTARNELLGSHPQSPIPAGEREKFVAVPVAPYDPALRFTARVDTDVAPARIEVQTGQLRRRHLRAGPRYARRWPRPTRAGGMSSTP